MTTTISIQKHLSRLRNCLPAFSLLAAIAWGGSGCSKDEPTPQTLGEPVFMNINTRALNNDTDQQINTVRILLVNKNIARTIDCNVFVSTPTDPLSIEAIAGNYDVYVVANETAGTTGLQALQTVRTLAELKTLTLPFSLTDRTFKNIPMFGEVNNVTITAPAAGESSATNPATVSIAGANKGSTLPVSLIRMACKLELLTLKRSNGTLKEVRFENLPDAIPLFADHSFTPATRPVMTLAGNTFTENASGTDPLFPNESSQKDILLPSWVFTDPSAQAEAVKMVAVVTEVVGKNSVDIEYSSAIGHATAAATADYTLQRNNAYTLTARIQNNTMTITAIVESWKEEDLNIEDDNPVVPTP